MQSKIIKTLTVIVLFAIILYVYPIGRLALTDKKVTKSIFVEEYYVKIPSDEFDVNVFRNYMETKGWQENVSKRMGGLYVFEKNGETKEIINKQIKTIFIGGKLNF